MKAAKNASRVNLDSQLPALPALTSLWHEAGPAHRSGPQARLLNLQTVVKAWRQPPTPCLVFVTSQADLEE